MSETLCGNAECDKTVTQSARGRSRKFCSAACRIRVHRCNETPGAIITHPAELDAPNAFPAKTVSFVTSKINDLATPKTVHRPAFRHAELSARSAPSKPKSSMLATGKRSLARVASSVTSAASANAPCRPPHERRPRARALKNAALARALHRSADDIFADIAERLQISTTEVRRLAAAA
jgi:hypothetical protein